MPVTHFYYNISMETAPQLPPETLCFHAQFRRRNPTRRGQPVTFSEATERGHYVGSLVSMQPLIGHSLGYLEGDEQAWGDGEKTPSIIGTEDYFGGAFNWDVNEKYETYTTPVLGVHQVVKPNGLYNSQQRHGMYRWHVMDPIRFAEDLRVQKTCACRFRRSAGAAKAAFCPDSTIFLRSRSGIKLLSNFARRAVPNAPGPRRFGNRAVGVLKKR